MPAAACVEEEEDDNEEEEGGEEEMAPSAAFTKMCLTSGSQETSETPGIVSFFASGWSIFLFVKWKRVSCKPRKKNYIPILGAYFSSPNVFHEQACVISLSPYLSPSMRDHASHTNNPHISPPPPPNCCFLPAVHSSSSSPPLCRFSRRQWEKDT